MSADTCVTTYAYACQVWITLQLNIIADCLTIALSLDEIRGIVDQVIDGFK